MTEQSVLIVDDAKFSATLIARRIASFGYTDIRTCHHAYEAIELLEQRPADVLIADWLMPDMDGLELCQQVREQDQRRNRFTYYLLVTAKDVDGAMTEAFDLGVDDFIAKSQLSNQLLPRITSAFRTSARMNQELGESGILKARLQQAQAERLKDVETGLGNNLYAQEMLERTLTHTHARGGATSFMSVKITNWEQITSQHKTIVIQELAIQTARKLKSLVRPLDDVCKLSDHEYGVIAHFQDAAHCNLGVYRRVFQSLDQQAIKTSAGYITINISCAVCFMEGENTAADLVGLCEFNAHQLQAHTGHKPFVVAPWAGERQAS